jgi:hypothetical protein
MTEQTAPVTTAGMEVKYFFKTEKLKDAEGNEIGDGRKHPDVVAVLPKPEATDVAEILAGADSPAKTLIMDAIENIIFLAGRSQINEFREKNPEGTFTANSFDLSKLTLEAIAMLPKKSRGGYAPTDEELKAFCEDYKSIMLQKVGYAPAKVAVHVKNLGNGLAKLKTEKKILEMLRQFLDNWAANTESMDEHQAVYEWLSERIAKWLKVEEKDLAEAF